MVLTQHLTLLMHFIRYIPNQAETLPEYTSMKLFRPPEGSRSGAECS